jgi:dTDP-4-dehydrorhamnose reductase
MRRIIITGAQGQLGQRLVEQLSQRAGLQAIGLDRSALDISSTKSIEQALNHWTPDAVINAAAYTAVDQAEDESELAHAVNAKGAGNLAQICAKRGLNFIHVSTDYVFDGKASTPYQSDQTPNPIGVYGASKLAGEEAVHGAFQNENTAAKFWIFRVSWLYDSVGKNFLTTMLRLAEKGFPLRVVEDQWGAPTAAGPLAAMLIDCIDKPEQLASGIWHYGTAGPTHWCGFAQAIFEFRNLNVEVHPCSSSEYPTKAPRPSYSYLDPNPLMQALGKKAIPWKEELKQCLLEQAESN